MSECKPLATGRFNLRHYTISAAPTGANRKLRKLLMSRTMPDMGALTGEDRPAKRARVPVFSPLIHHTRNPILVCVE